MAFRSFFAYVARLSKSIISQYPLGQFRVEAVMVLLNDGGY